MALIRKKFSCRFNAEEYDVLNAYAVNRGLSKAETIRDFIKLMRGDSSDPAALVKDALMQQGAVSTYFLPDDRKALLTDLAQAIILGKEIWIIAYTWSNIALTKALQKAIANGCKVHMLLDNSQAWDQEVHAYATPELGVVQPLARAGADITVTSSPLTSNGQNFILHQKAILIDDGEPSPMFVRGSLNFSQIGVCEGNIVDVSRSLVVSNRFKAQFDSFKQLGLQLYPNQPFKTNA